MCCRYVTELLGGEKYVSCSVALPALCHVSRVMESSDEDPAYVTTFKTTFRKDLETCKENANIAYLKIATALEPRFKDHRCLPRAERSEVWALVTNLLKEQVDVEEKPVEEKTSEPPKKKLTPLADSSESDSEQEHDSIENNVHRYRAEPTVSSDSCPLEWWSKHAHSHSMLAPYAQKYLGTPATSVPCERLFSLAGHIVQKKRASLSSENLNNLVCLSNWLTGYVYCFFIKQDSINALSMAIHFSFVFEFDLIRLFQLGFTLNTYFTAAVLFCF